MWEKFDAYVLANQRDRYSALREPFADTFRNSGLRLNDLITKKMVGFDFGTSERLVWEVESPGNVFLHAKWREIVEANGYVADLRPYQHGLQDGGRHSALARRGSFDKADCIVVRIDGVQSLERLIDLVLKQGDRLVLDPAVVSSWINQLRHFFPNLTRFDQPDQTFDDLERSYKLQTAVALRSALDAAETDAEVALAVLRSLEKSNLIDWRAYLPMSPKGGADRVILDPAIRAIVSAAVGPTADRAQALEEFVSAWKLASPGSKADPARQIGEFLFLHLDPVEGVFIRHSVRQDLWLQATGTRFPDHVSMAATYREEMRFMEAVRQAFAARGLAPRDMLDVQSALWVIHNYKIDNPRLTRVAVEAAMDAYDRRREAKPAYDQFAPTEGFEKLWVRSTRDRPDRRYPAAAIVSLALSDTAIDGGWATPQSAAARLYNSGFIVVDEYDRSLAPPERYTHLIEDAERIKLCAFHYSVEPAREAQAQEVTIAVDSLADDLNLDGSYEAICDELNGEAFQKLASVAAPQHTMPVPHPHARYTFRLSNFQEPVPMTSERNRNSVLTTNLILYGPPGTGKTYATALEAVRLCRGETVADQLADDRPALMSEYRRLADEGRIEFVTFHQSMAYEDFVEGRQPTTDLEDGTSDSSGGFRLEVVPGVLRRLAKRAETGLEMAASYKQMNIAGRQIYKMSLGSTQDLADQDVFSEAMEGGYAVLDWEDIDWSDVRFSSAEEILKTCREQGKIEGPVSLSSGQVSITDMFRNRLKAGDIIVVSKGNQKFRAIGEVIGAYEYSPRAGGRFSHRRAVKWLWSSLEGEPVSEIYDGPFTMRSLYELKKDRLKLPALERLMNSASAEVRPDGVRENFVLIIDEINRANISKVFGELITLLEADKRLGRPNALRVRLPYSREEFGLPTNLHIIGTMNTADRSIALLDTALRRRFTFRELMPDVNALRAALRSHGFDAENLDGIDLCRLLMTLNERIEYLFDREHQIGHAYFTGCRNRADIEDVMRHKIIPLLAEYFYEDWSKVAAVLGDGPSRSRSGFLEATRLVAPVGFGQEDFAGDKLRWTVKTTFDFSDFAA